MMLSLRPATLADADAIHALTQAAYAEYQATPAPSSALAETARDVRDAMYSGAWSAAIVRLAGKGVRSGRLQGGAGGGDFFRLAVPPEHRRQGVAQAIVTW